MVNRLTSSLPNIPTNSSSNSISNEVIEINTPQSISTNLQGEESELPFDKAKKMTESMNRFMESTNTNLRFQYHEELKEYYVTIVDSQTNEVVKEIPSKKLMDIYAAMRDFLGVLVDHKI